jgi:succinate dehydrogenase / fumarate reductase, cytochrome b subunit
MASAAVSQPARARRQPWPLAFYSTAIGKKWVMAVTGIVLLGYVLVHMLGNLKFYMGAEDINKYGEALRTLGGAFVPKDYALWALRLVLLGAFLLHVHAAYALTMMNRRARPTGYAAGRHYVAANVAARTMRWTGVIILLYLLFHLFDLTFGPANPDFQRGEVYHNLLGSLERWWSAIIYIVANVALAVHIYHGAWSVFQSMGINHPRINQFRRAFATGFAALMLVSNLSFPILIATGAVG